MNLRDVYNKTAEDYFKNHKDHIHITLLDFF